MTTLQPHDVVQCILIVIRAEPALGAEREVQQPAHVYYTLTTQSKDLLSGGGSNMTMTGSPHLAGKTVTRGVKPGK
jgi:hypothetical protein